MWYGVFIGKKNTSPQTFTVLRIFLGYEIIYFLNSVAGIIVIKVVLLLYVLYTSEFYVLVDRPLEVGGVPPKRVAVNNRLYFCVSQMFVCWFYK